MFSMPVKLMLFLIVWINCKFMEVAKLPPDFTNFWGALLDSPNIFHIFSQARDGSTKEGRQNGLHEGFPLFFLFFSFSQNGLHEAFPLFSSSKTTELIQTLQELRMLSSVRTVISVSSHKSPGWVGWVGWVGEWVRRSPIEMFWTAKNHGFEHLSWAKLLGGEIANMLLLIWNCFHLKTWIVNLPNLWSKK